MNRIPVSSSNLVSVGFDESISLLEIEFKEGRIYQYSNVPKEVYDGLMSASSHGTFFHQFIKDKFPTKRVN